MIAVDKSFSIILFSAYLEEKYESNMSIRKFMFGKNKTIFLAFKKKSIFLIRILFLLKLFYY